MWGWNLPHHEFKRVNPKLSASQQEQTCLPPLILSFSPILSLAPPSPPPPLSPPFSSVQGSCSYTKMIFMILFHLFIFCWEDGVNRCSRLLKHMQTCMEIRYIKELIQSLFHTTGGNFVYMKKLDLIWNLIWFITSNYKKYMITSCVFFLHWIRIWGDFVFTSMAHCKEKPNKCFLWVGLVVVFCHFFLSVPFALKYLASILYVASIGYLWNIWNKMLFQRLSLPKPISLSPFDKMNCFQLPPSSFQDFLRRLYPKLMFLVSLVCVEQAQHSAWIKTLQCPWTSLRWDELFPVVASPFCGFPSQLHLRLLSV